MGKGVRYGEWVHRKISSHLSNSSRFPCPLSLFMLSQMLLARSHSWNYWIQADGCGGRCRIMDLECEDVFAVSVSPLSWLFIL